MEEFWISCCVWAAIFVFMFIAKYRSNKRLYEKVSWCMIERKKGSGEIFDCIWSFQYNFPEQYKIKQDEKSNVAFILDAFQDALSNNYFDGSLSKSSKILRLTKEEYFFLALRDFLKKRECGISLNGIEKYILLEKKSYGMWGTELYSAKYRINNFGITYTKLLYFSSLYCENNARMEKLGIIKYSEKIRNRIDTQLIELSVM